MLETLPPPTAIRAEIARRAAERARQDVERNAEAIRARCQTLAGFVREAWHVLEPEAEYVHSWHIDAVCAHLEAVTDGRILRLLINIPPGTMKSLLVSVLWPAWESGPKGMRSLRYLATAFNDGPVKRDTRKCRDLMLSEWYRTLWPEVVLTRTAEMSFANSSTGTREGVAFGSLTSQRGDRVLIDDPHSTDTAESETERAATTRRFRERAIFSVNDPKRSAVIVIMQRLHENDISGVILAQKMGFVHLCLPMEFEVDRRCETEIGFVDPRTYEGELLCPERYPREEVDQQKRDMGSYATAGQFQQRPTPRGGGLFKRSWFKTIINAIPSEIIKWIRYWDKAGKAGGEGARTAGALVGVTRTKQVVIADIVSGRWGTVDREVVIKQTAETDRIRFGRVETWVEQEPGSGGMESAEGTVRRLAGFRVKKDKPGNGESKEERADQLAIQMEIGNVSCALGPWNADLLSELQYYPASTYKDQGDACSGAFNILNRKVVHVGAWG